MLFSIMGNIQKPRFSADTQDWCSWLTHRRSLPRRAGGFRTEERRDEAREIF